MTIWKMLTSNYLINVGIVAWMSAQILKFILTFVFTKHVVVERLWGAGGMPSAHSALVCSLTIAMAKKVGFASPLFALTLAFAGIVMHDAMGVRRAAGEQAKVLNKMIKLNYESDAEENKELKEFLGHTPLQVLGGALLGIFVAMVMPLK